MKVWAIKNNILCVQPKTNTELLSIFSSKELRLVVCSEKKLEEEKYDLFIVIAYGKIIPENILNMPKLGSVNIHYSLLPKYRGASPVESAILNGDTETGVTIQQMEFKMDAGAIITQEKVNIFPDEKTPDLRKRLIKIGGELLIKILTPSASSTSPYVGGGWVGVKQDETLATFCKKIKKGDGLVNLETESSSVLYNKFRAYATWPRTFFFQNDKRIIVTGAELVDNKFLIKKVLPEGRKEISWDEFKKQTS